MTRRADVDYNTGRYGNGSSRQIGKYGWEAVKRYTMISGLWNVCIKVPDLTRELEFHRAIGNQIVLDETFTVGGEECRIPLVKMGDKYLHLAEKLVYEEHLEKPLPYGLAHIVYLSSQFDADLACCLKAGATQICEPLEVSAGFGERKVAFLRSPNGWLFEIAKIYRHGVPEVA